MVGMGTRGMGWTLWIWDRNQGYGMDMRVWDGNQGYGMGTRGMGWAPESMGWTPGVGMGTREYGMDTRGRDGHMGRRKDYLRVLLHSFFELNVLEHVIRVILLDSCKCACKRVCMNTSVQRIRRLNHACRVSALRVD